MNDIPEAYRSKTQDQALAHLIEELAESIEAAAKSLRFGLESVNPETDDPETNLEWLHREMANGDRAWAAFLDFPLPGKAVVGDLGQAMSERNIS